MKKIIIAVFMPLLFACLQEAGAQVVCTIDNTATYTLVPTFANGASYKSFADAISKLNAATITSPVVFNVTAGQTFNETSILTITKTGSASNTITFQKSGAGSNPIIIPAVGVGNSDVGIKLQAVSYVTIDGIDIKDGPAYTAGLQAIESGFYLTTSTTVTCGYNTIQNCSVSLNNSNTNLTYGVYQTSTSGTGPSCLNNTYNNINISNVYAGIYLIAKAALSDENCTIKNCTIGTATPNSIGNAPNTALNYGIYGRFQNNLTVSNCEVRNVVATATTTASEVNGIALINGGGTSNIYGNNIHDISNKGTSSTVGGTNGIQVSLNASSQVNIYNNFITGLYTGDMVSPAGIASAIKLAGITIAIGSLGTTNIYHNSILIQNSTNNYLVPNTCINASSTQVNTINLVNNILKNNYASGGAVTGYCVYTNNTSANAYTTLGVFDYNNYDIATGSGKHTGRILGAAQTTLANWQTATGKEVNGKQFSTAFLNTTPGAENLHLNLATSNPNYFGTPIPSPAITVDIDGDARDATNPYIGADEKLASPLPVAITGVKAYQKQSGVQLDWTVATEMNLDRYRLEKSNDGRLFHVIGTVPANNKGKYDWLDNTPFNGDNYYRIVAVDKSGAATYSPIVNVKIGKEKNMFSIIGNPLHNKTLVLQLLDVDKGKYHIRIINALGQSVLAATMQHAGGSASNTWLLDGLTSGLYHLNISGGTTQVNKQFVIR